MDAEGLYQPVDMNGVLNTVKSGSTVPLKFELFAGATELTNTADVKSLTSAQIPCDLEPDRRHRAHRNRRHQPPLRHQRRPVHLQLANAEAAGNLPPSHHEVARRLDTGGPVQAEVTEVEVP